MKKMQAQINRVVLVVIGNFNPSILHPDWFERHSVLPAEELEGLFAEPVKKEIPELGVNIEISSAFMVDQNQSIIKFKSLHLNCNRNKLQISCENIEKIELLVALVKKIFFILSETPVTALGINFFEHYKCTETYSEIANKLYNPTQSLLKYFGSDVETGFKIASKFGDSKLNFVIDKSPVTNDGILLRFNYHFNNDKADTKVLFKDIEKKLASSKDNAEKIMKYYIRGVLEYLPIPRTIEQ